MDTRQEPGQRSAYAILKALKRRIFFLLVPVILITGAMAYYTGRLPVRYRAQALVASETAAPDPYLGNRSEAAVALNVQEHLRTIREVLFSPSVLETVVREFKLYDTAGQHAMERATELTKQRIQIQVDSPTAFYVGFDGDQPQQVAQVANRLAALFVERTSDIRGEHVAQVDSLLDQEVERLRTQLKQQEESLKNYKDSVAQALPDRLNTNLKLLEDLQEQAQIKTDKIAEAQAQRAAIVNEMLSMESQGALEAAPRQKTANEARLDDLRLKLRQLQTRYTAENPEIQQTIKEIHDLEALGTPLGTRQEPSAFHMRYNDLQAELTSIDQRIKSYQQERASLSSRMSGYEKRINSSPGLETTLAERMKDASLTRAQYEAMLAKQQAEKLDQKVEKTSKQNGFKVIEAAQVPAAPYSPQRQRMILLAFLASLGLGFGLVLLLEHMDSTFQTIEEVQQFTTIPVLSSIPSINGSLPRIYRSRNGNNSRGTIGLDEPRRRGNGITLEERRRFHAHHLTVLSDPQSIASQQYSILSLKVQRWQEKTQGGVLVVTSAAGGEGKSLTALNLSMALASSAEGRVLLMDCDLRRPQVHTRLGIAESPGLSDALNADRGDLSPYISKVADLYVMTGGDQGGESAAILSRRRTREIIDTLRKEFQWIVLDSPPIVPIADSHFLAGLADGVILVIRARQTRRELLQRAVESLGPTDLLGVVLNDVEYGDTRYAYAYRYYQRHYMRGR